MDRTDDITTLPADTDWLNDPDARRVCAALQADGGKVYFVGGCVRDALLNVVGSDVDLSTDVLPQDVTRLAKSAGLKAIPTGIEHGTVTVVAGGKGYEVTTFRRDVKTDGRRAVVSFSKEISDDARRRDFTLNALYATPEGVLVDPIEGLQDCLDRRIRFIEDAGSRITEDYLRILRYFRFHAWYANPDDGFDAADLDQISRYAHGLERLSAERVGVEMLKLLSAPDPCQAIAAMAQTGCLRIILPGSDDVLLGPVVHLESEVNNSPDAVLRLAALGGENALDRLRLSKATARRLDWLRTAGYGMTPLQELAYRNGYTDALAAALLRGALAQQPVSEIDLHTLQSAAAERFPISAADLMPAFEGKALGYKLQALEQQWIKSGFRLTREDLITGN